MPTIFSHPVYVPSGNWTTTGYNLVKSPALGNTTLAAPITATGTQTMTLTSGANFANGQTVTVDYGTNQESITISNLSGNTCQGTFTKTHAAGVAVQSPALAPNYFGPWVPVQSGYTSNTDILDVNGCSWDLYRVQPIITVGTNTNITLDYSRPFYPNQTLYDVQISALIDYFRRSYIDDVGIRQTNSTVTTEDSGSAVLPFMTDPNTSRYYLSFMPNEDPIKFIAENTLVYHGTTKSNATPLISYTDYFPAEMAGYIDFKSNPASNDYLKVEYTHVRFTNDEIRNALLNAISSLSLYGINNYQVNQSNNLLYLAIPLQNRDLADIVCLIAAKEIMQAKVLSSFETSEAWKDGKGVEYTSDPSRGIQAATMHVANVEKELIAKASAYIYQTRNYVTRGEFDSFFDTSGILPVYTLFISNYNAFGWWL